MSGRASTCSFSLDQWPHHHLQAFEKWRIWDPTPELPDPNLWWFSVNWTDYVGEQFGIKLKNCPSLPDLHGRLQDGGVEGHVLTAPARTPKLQLAAEQPSTGEGWIPPEKDTPHPRAKEKPQQDSRRGEIAFGIKAHTHQTPSQNCVWASPAEVQVSSGLLQRRGLWEQHTWVCHEPSWNKSPLTPPQSRQNLHRTGK